ncbi:MAG: type II toxin-antitoxin system RelE/ParE family toxin [Cyclobacteriaceae bacterium]|jgi:toxin ParE1/3/4|nr:type II toxin-antitoxin system RelE/ParE family toxin [Flammeovirgaceae bacterium]
MKVVYSEYALNQLEVIIDFLLNQVKIPPEKVIEIQNSILDKADSIIHNIHMGQKEEILDPLGQSHRRVIVNNYKIIYVIKNDYILITDIFDARQDPQKMKG